MNMKKVLLNLAVTLDGYIEGPNGEIDWCIMDDDMDFEEFLPGIDTIFFGRISYDAWIKYQPGPDAPTAEMKMWNIFDSKRKVVFTSQIRKDENAEYISSNLAEKVAEIKLQGGKDIWLFGGAKLVTSFIRLDLIDEYQLSVHPVALGSGKPLFKNLEQRLALRLIKTRQFRSGVVQMIYEPGNK
jgi:dihydrofolate reductase